MFINARTDVYLRGLAGPDNCLSDSIGRLNKYVASGADGVFVPAMTSPRDIAQVSSLVQAPLNIMVSSDSDNLKELVVAGARRISLGPSSFIDAYSTLANISQTYWRLIAHSSR